MSVCAVMLVKDEADILPFTIEHLSRQVDHVFVSDNGSTDDTRQLLDDLMYEPFRGFLSVTDDPEVGYWQSKKTTALAMQALLVGYKWVVPCDADEFWYAPDGRTLKQTLDGMAPDVMVVEAQLFNHIPTADDVSVEDEPNPFVRLGWRKREHGVLGKVACRLRPDLVIEAGNHSASTSGAALRSGGLVVRHYSWRSAEQYVRKIRNGQAAYAATDLPADVGLHWRMWEHLDDEAVADHFRLWFWTVCPEADDSLIYDPAPVGFDRPAR